MSLVKRYTVRAYDGAGAFAFGATLQCLNDAAAIQKFEDLPLGDHRAELWAGKTLICDRAVLTVLRAS